MEPRDAEKTSSQQAHRGDSTSKDVIVSGYPDTKLCGSPVVFTSAISCHLISFCMILKFKML